MKKVLEMLSEAVFFWLFVAILGKFDGTRGMVLDTLDSSTVALVALVLAWAILQFIRDMVNAVEKGLHRG